MLVKQESGSKKKKGAANGNFFGSVLDLAKDVTNTVKETAQKASKVQGAAQKITGTIAASNDKLKDIQKTKNEIGNAFVNAGGSLAGALQGFQSAKTVGNSYENLVNDIDFIYNNPNEYLNNPDKFQNTIDTARNIQNDFFNKYKSEIQKSLNGEKNEIGDIYGKFAEQLNAIDDLKYRQEDAMSVLNSKTPQEQATINETLRNLDTGELNKQLAYLASEDDSLLERMGKQVFGAADSITNSGVDAFNLGLIGAQNVVQGIIGEDNYKNIFGNIKTPEQYAEETKARDESSELIQAQVYNGVNNPIERGLLDILRSTAEFAGYYAVSLGNPVLTSAMMGGSKGIDVYTEDLRNGYDNNTALLHGGVSAILSYFINRKLPLENLGNIFSNKAKGDLLSYVGTSIATQMFSEGGEEIIEAISDELLNQAILGEESRFDDLGFWQETLYSGLLGALSGGLMGGFASGFNAVKTKRQYNQITQNVRLLQDYLDHDIELDSDSRFALEQVIRSADAAAKQYMNKSVLAKAVTYESDIVPNVTYDQVMSNLNKINDIDRPKVESAFNNAYNLLNSSQQMLNANGINMDVTQFANLDTDIQNQIVKVQETANKLGVNTYFDNNAPTDGMYDPKSDIVIINPTSDLGSLPVFMHEITHKSENSNYYYDLRDFVFEGKTRDQLADSLSYIKNEYDQNGIQLDGNDLLSEYVAIETQNDLSNENFVKRLVNYNDSLGYRLYEGIKNLTNSSDRAKQIEYNFLKAFRDSKSISTNSTFNANYSDPQLQHALNIQRAKAVSKNSFDSNGNLLSTEEQIENMTKDPSRYSHVVVDPGDSLSFAGIDGEIYLTNKVRKKINNKHHLSNEQIALLLDNIDNTVVLGLDYVDVRDKTKLKNLILLDNNNNDYILSLKPTSKRDYEVDIISSLFDEPEIYNYIDKSISLGNTIYTNEKSSNYLSGFVQARDSLDNIATFINNISNNEENVKHSIGLETNNLNQRLSGDDLLNAIDRIEELKTVGTEIDDKGYVTLYHRTDRESAAKIKDTKKMTANEDGVFFSTSENGTNNSGYGDSVVKVKMPIENLEIDDIFDDEASIRVPLDNKNSILDISRYLVSNDQSSINDLKQKQLDIVLNSNPAFNDTSTWIRSIDDIKTYEETLSDPDYADYLEDGFTPDYTADMAKEALDTGKMKVYSSYPIKNGTWVTPSRMEAESYAGNGQVYSKEIDLDDVAWVDPTQGMYANTKTDNNAKYSIGLKSNIPNEDLSLNPDQKDGNINTEVNYGTDDFRRVQEESRRVAENGRWYESYKKFDEKLRSRLSDVFRRELESRTNSNGNAYGLLDDTGDFKVYSNVDAQTFRDMFEIARTYTKNGELVDLHDVETTDEHGIGYKYCKNYLTDDGLSGFSITPDGDLVSVFNASDKRGFLRSISNYVKSDAKTLDCYVSPNQPLSKMYEKVFGFKVASTMDYNMEYDHDNIALNHGKPQVAFMVNTDQDVKTKHFNKDQYDEAVNYRNSFIDNDSIYANNIPEGETIRGNKQDTGKYFKQGENPDRDVKIEKETDYGNTNRFARTIAESDNLSDEQVSLLQKEIGKGKFAYKPVSNKQLVDNANDKVSKIGIDKMYENYIENHQPDSRSIAEGELLLQQLAKTDSEKALKIASIVASDLTEAGRTVQAARIFKRLSPEGKLLSVERARNRIQKHLDERYGKGAQEIVIDEDLKKQLLNSKDQIEAENIVNQIEQNMADQMPNDIFDKMNAWRYFAMLANPRTHIRNILGNAVFSPIIDTKNFAASAIESLVSKINPNFERTKSVINPFNADDKALIDFGKADYDKYKDQFNSQSKYAIDEAIKNKQTYFKDKGIGKLANKLINKSSDLLDAEDLFFSKRRYASSLAEYLKSHNITVDEINNPSDIKTLEIFNNAQEYAYKESLKATYRDDSKLASNLAKLENMNKGTKFIFGGLIPFKKTPINIVKRGIEYSPAGLVKVLYNGATGLKNGKITGAEFIDQLASGLSGTGIMLLGMFLASKGIIRTNDDDSDRKERFDSDMGSQDYAIVLPFGTYTIDWLSPSIMPLAMGVEMYNVADEGLEEVSLGSIVDTLMRVADPITETSMLKNASDILTQYGDSGTQKLGSLLGDTVASYINQFIPTLGGQVARTIDDTRRTTYPNEGFIDSFARQVMNKVPGLSFLNEPYVNRHGEIEKQEDLGLGALGRLFLNMVSPGYYNSNIADEYDDEYYRLFDSTGDLDAFPTNSTNKFSADGVEFELSPSDYTSFQETKWQNEKKYVDEFIDSDVYEELSDQEKVDIIGKIRSYISDKTKYDYLNSKGIDYGDPTVEKVDSVLSSGLPIYNYFIADSYYKNLSGDNKQSDYIDYLNDSDLSSEQKNILYDMQYGSSVTTQNINNFADRYDLSSDQELAMKEAITTKSLKDENGNTIKNSKALQVRDTYEKMGMYDSLLDYIGENGLEYGDFGLNKTVVGYSDSRFNSEYASILGNNSGGTQTSGSRSSRRRSTKKASSYGMSDSDYNKAITKIDNIMSDTLDKLVSNSSSVFDFNIEPLDLSDFKVDVENLLKTDNDVKDIFDKYKTSNIEELIDDYLDDHPYSYLFS